MNPTATASLWVIVLLIALLWGIVLVLSLDAHMGPDLEGETLPEYEENP
jgi:hypothetical protein